MIRKVLVTMVACFTVFSLLPLGNADATPGSVARLAVLEFLAAHGAAPDEVESDALAGLAAMPLDIQMALAEILASFYSFEAAGSRAMGFVTVESASGLDADTVVVADDQQIAAARDAFLFAIGDLRRASSSTSNQGGFQTELEVDADLDVANQNFLVAYEFFKATIHPNFDDPEMTDIEVEHDSQICAGLPFNFTLAPILNIDLRNVDNVYVDDYLLSIDTCGDDVYLNNAGGNGRQVGPGCTRLPASALVDLGGDDTYGNASAPRSCGVNGGGNMGAGFLFDASGDDEYFAAAHGVNGGSTTGSGFLLDLEGDDVYNAAEGGTNGGCNVLGRGALVDFVGADTYTATFGAVNGGAALGCAGVLFDGEGIDSYTAGSGAVNGGVTFAGIGLLLDRHGTGDVYLDFDGGSGTDKTVVPKGVLGAQVDLPRDV